LTPAQPRTATDFRRLAPVRGDLPEAALFGVADELFRTLDDDEAGVDCERDVRPG